ncbi:MAG: dihydropteroate synthase [Candidatus Omnitrophota bacterium]|nr:dihydropteroate synthase [Candidatus Omnitrophota bacterium]
MNLRLLELKDIDEIADELRALKVHPGGIGIMAPKALSRVIKIKGLDSVALNILKQDMLSIGGDCAVSWDAFIKRTKNAEGIIIGTIAQIDQLCEKLERQPLGLSELGKKLRLLEDNLNKRDFILSAGRYKLKLGARTHIMGILNVTPDSFSDGGLYTDREEAVRRAIEMESQGADIIDVGGESTRPGARTVSAEEECERVVPLIRVLAKKIKVPISVDTSKLSVARKALDCGAVIVNDISGLKKEPKIARLVKKHKAAIVLTHMKGTPRTMQKNPKYKSLVCDITEGLRRSISIAKDAGISDNSIIIDPGIGFGKTVEHNLEILKRLREFKSLGYPILVGTSRKSFIGKVLAAEAQERLFGTAASVAVAIQNGVNILRIHDVDQMRQVARLTDAILNV